MTDHWVHAMEPAAPDLVAVWRRIEPGQSVRARRELRRLAGKGSVERTLRQLEETADALVRLVEGLPEAAFSEPGGEGGWNVAETVGHVASARAGLVIAAGLAASGRWPADAPTVVPGVPGPPSADRGELVRQINRSRRIIVRTAARIAGHETDPCPLDHPLVGRLRCGEWLFFAGVHDLMHIEQLEAIAERLAGRANLAR
ncbi:MAG TPA: DinB family protein [Candidatus Limnocylindrales bacterium]|nr:DinB family protein [Candidatus Limnocylindrales bacterium]